LLVLLLVVAFATSGLLHAVGGGYEAFAASHSDEFASESHDSAGEPCCPEHKGQAHGKGCSIASGCSLCVPLVAFAVLTYSPPEAIEIQPEAIHFGRVLSPDFRPPKLTLNV